MEKQGRDLIIAIAVWVLLLVVVFVLPKVADSIQYRYEAVPRTNRYGRWEDVYRINRFTGEAELDFVRSLDDDPYPKLKWEDAWSTAPWCN